jgi:hypothetical protein
MKVRDLVKKLTDIVKFNEADDLEDLVQIFSCLKDILVGTELILFCGPRYFGIFRERTCSCVDGEDGIG